MVSDRGCYEHGNEEEDRLKEAKKIKISLERSLVSSQAHIFERDQPAVVTLTSVADSQILRHDQGFAAQPDTPVRVARLGIGWLPFSWCWLR